MDGLFQPEKKLYTTTKFYTRKTHTDVLIDIGGEFFIIIFHQIFLMRNIFASTCDFALKRKLLPDILQNQMNH